MTGSGDRVGTAGLRRTIGITIHHGGMRMSAGIIIGIGTTAMRSITIIRIAASTIATRRIRTILQL